MDNTKQVSKIMSNFEDYKFKNLSPFVKIYIEKLLYNILTYVDTNIKLNNIEIETSYTGRCDISQAITGVPGAYSCIDGDDSALIAFAENYSHLGIESYDLLAKEVLMDFLNLHNGLFVVKLSKDNICELSLDVPQQNGNHSLDSSTFQSITIVSILFSYGVVKFLLCEL